MFDTIFSQNSSEQATSTSIIIAVVCSFFLSSLIVLTYEFTHRNKPKSAQFMMSMALISIVAATVMQAVGDSLARGLGMLGALAIIRFRTNLDNPMSITYMFASLAVGISCGVFGFTIAFAGTLTFCIAAILLHYSPFWGTENFRGNLKINLDMKDDAEKKVEALLQDFCKSFRIDQFRINSSEVSPVESGEDEEVISLPPVLEKINSKEITYHIWLKDQDKASQLMDKIYAIPGIKNARIRFSVPDPEL
ncbi:MAG: DUF4956 domain-containing protein [Bacteroidota bacterium]